MLKLWKIGNKENNRGKELEVLSETNKVSAASCFQVFCQWNLFPLPLLDVLIFSLII